MGCSCKVRSAWRRGGGQSAGVGVTDIYLAFSRGGLWTVSIFSGPRSSLLSPERGPAATLCLPRVRVVVGTLCGDVSKPDQHDAFLGEGYFEPGASEPLCK